MSRLKCRAKHHRLLQQKIQAAHMIGQDVAVEAVIVPHFLDVIVLKERLESMEHSFLLILHSGMRAQ